MHSVLYSEANSTQVRYFQLQYQNLQYSRDTKYTLQKLTGVSLLAVSIFFALQPSVALQMYSMLFHHHRVTCINGFS